MKGWKTWAAIGIVALAAVAQHLGYKEFADLLYGLGAAMGLWGVAHKIEKSGGPMALLALSFLLAACAGPTGAVGSPEQIRELSKIKDAVAICVQLNTPWGPQRTSILSVDRGLSATVAVDKECGVSLTVTQPEPKKPVAAPPTP